MSWGPSISIDTRRNVHVAWSDYTDYAGSGTDADIFYKSWYVDNSAWSTTEVVSTENYQDTNRPAVCVDPEDALHIIWEDTSIIDGNELI